MATSEVTFAKGPGVGWSALGTIQLGEADLRLPEDQFDAMLREQIEEVAQRMWALRETRVRETA